MPNRTRTALVGLLASTALLGLGAPPAAAQQGVVLTKVIVRLKPVANLDAELSRARDLGGQVGFRYRTALLGFAVEIPQQAVEALRRNPAILSVEPDVPVTTTQAPPWGLDRIDQRALPLSGTYTAPADGSGVNAYVVDTGILGTHADFGGRVRSGFTAINDGRGTTDCDGHGTHVAGTVAGATYGVAKRATPVAVRVLGCNGSGSTSGVIAGVDWIAADHAAGTPAVANLSLGGPASASLDAAVTALVDDGVSVVVSAGNDGVNACTQSPARTAPALTVAATDRTDTRASYSNLGSCVDLFAPGSGIVSDWYTGPSATATLSGTSMASPHVAGAAAVLLSQQRGLAPADVASRLTGSATTGVVRNPGTGTPNRLLYVGSAGGTPPTTTPTTTTPITTTPVTTTTTPPTTPTTTTAPACAGSGQKIANPGFESGATGWSASPGVIAQPGGARPARTGTWNATLGGRGTTSSSVLTQIVTVPAGCRTATLSFWMRVDSAETAATADDRLTVTVGTTTVGTFSNLDRGTGYVQRTISLTGVAGTSAILRFAAVEDGSLATSFAIDDTALAVS